VSERRFRVMDGAPSVPWWFVEPHEAQALANHDQTLERLNERGGLSAGELWSVVHGKRWRDAPTDDVARAWLKTWLENDVVELIAKFVESHSVGTAALVARIRDGEWRQ
jgi:hypothetical protein